MYMCVREKEGKFYKYSVGKCLFLFLSIARLIKMRNLSNLNVWKV